MGLLVVLLVVVLVAVVSQLRSSEDDGPLPRTVAVSRGTVVASVSATGNVTADTELALDFASGGRLVELAVKVGDRVVAGQVLARVDGREGRDGLAAAGADLASARAELARVLEGPSPEERAAHRASVARAQRQVEAAQTVLSGARAAAVQNEKDYDASVEQARREVSQARARQGRNERTYRDDVRQAERDVDAAERAVDDARRGNDLIDRVTGARRNAESELRAARARLTDARNAERSGRLADQQAVDDAEDGVTNARNRAASGRLADQQAVRDAEAGVGSARADLDSAVAEARLQEAPASAAEVAAARAGVARAAAGVSSAEKDLEDATLRAPTAGTVARVAGEVGELVAGSRVGSLDELDGDGTADTSAASSTASQRRGFIVLTDLDTLQVEAGFSEVDAAQVRLGQPVTLTFEALPDQEVAARVAAVDPTSTLVRNVVTYDVTMVLERDVQGVKPGMTASAEVVVAERADVVRVPNSAVARRADRATVTVLEAGRPVEREVTLGLRGDESTEVVAGLSVGDRVVPRTAPPRNSGGLGR